MHDWRIGLPIVYPLPQFPIVQPADCSGCDGRYIWPDVHGHDHPLGWGKDPIHRHLGVARQHELLGFTAEGTGRLIAVQATIEWMLLRETTRKIAVDIRRNPIIRFTV